MGEFCGDLTKLDHYGSYLQATVAICVNDSKSLADALLSAGAAASKVSEDKRLAIETGMIMQRLAQRETRLQRVEGSMMPADVLTKGKARGHVDLFRQFTRTCRYRIKPTSEVLEERRSARESQQM